MEAAAWYDSKADGGEGRWAYEYDMMDGVHVDYDHMQTGEQCSVDYWFPFGGLWDDINTCLIEKDGYFYKRKNVYSEDEVAALLASRRKCEEKE